LHLRIVQRPHSSAEALAKARAYCARQERCQQEVRDKLYAWQVSARDIEPIISQLISEGFLNEARFAEHYAVSKFRQKGWGLRKIEQALRLKQVSEPCIRSAVRSIEQQEYSAALQQAVSKRWERTKEPDPYVKRQKVFRYFLGKGFATEAVEQALRALEAD
jgi:regulatory protein